MLKERREWERVLKGRLSGGKGPGHDTRICEAQHDLCSVETIFQHSIAEERNLVQQVLHDERYVSSLAFSLRNSCGVNRKMTERTLTRFGLISLCSRN